MGQATIQFENVSKEFKLSKLRVRSLQEMFVHIFKPDARGKRRFWALREVSFSIEPGNTVAILGPNGSGKSTILKLISRIIDPTAGVIRISGRLSALLELGAGFHPDLTGRENIFLNGSILGLNRKAMLAKLDDIIAFADIGEFIDVPIRSYSSGMQVRLGFAVAVHVEPEIILVDEVLAVGDYSFQRKCLERIRQMQQAGVTILFVSHDFEAARELCNQAIWMDEGRLQAQGEVAEVLRLMRERYGWEGEESVLAADKSMAARNRLAIG